MDIQTRAPSRNCPGVSSEEQESGPQVAQESLRRLSRAVTISRSKWAELLKRVPVSAQDNPEGLDLQRGFAILLSSWQEAQSSGEGLIASAGLLRSLAVPLLDTPVPASQGGCGSGALRQRNC